jgi:DNA adenine methylase
MREPIRPIIRYHGSKWSIAPWVISYIPKHKVYVEPYGGGASLLLRKSRAHEEVYNDLDSDIVNLFRVVRDNGEELKRLLALTPFSRQEYLEAYKPTDDPIERARRTLIRGYMGRASTGATGKISDTGRIVTGFRAKTVNSGKTAAKLWNSYPELLQAIIERLKGVVIENKDALEVIKQHDSPQTLFYIDPPYVLATRDEGTDYRYEMTDQDHITLSERLNKVTGSVIVSGYHSELYNELYKGWLVREKMSYSDGDKSKPRTEVLDEGNRYQHGAFLRGLCVKL